MSTDSKEAGAEADDTLPYVVDLDAALMSRTRSPPTTWGDNRPRAATRSKIASTIKLVADRLED